ncbi:hypothetical protein KUTeg_016004 [Tegillarca granosa]|uniref:SMC hinge domain-containing protein n=1 Tax=Tegillarca granosa TaxID=220873 RepID=A0ABQ9EKS7_TEGGR|nr:hypothetical protein KUTeg_016004 [Tegillarca granosa]
MHIKSIIIDGFKSYAQRTEIHGFDPLFNAITGLNGSGKSNILDSICFLLGITNLTHVRATNLQELVYKNGQAGITKATVSITFDNVDKKQSPLGYEQYDEITVSRQVVIGGRNKYLINGSNANNTRVQDLFRSVQLNVNNPHFLIMQGRITKVLNMKPPEILSMIEEAAGTRLYESKKEAAQKTIEKKDAKLQEIDSILKEDITPTLTKLKEERSSYLEYQKIIRELEHLNKLYIAYQFVCAEEKKKKSAEELLEMQEGIKNLKQKIEEIENKVKELDTVIAKLEKKRDEESGSAMQKLEDKLKDVQKSEAMSQSAIDNKKEGLKAEQKKKKELIKNSEDDKKALSSKEGKMSKVSEDLVALQEQSTADEEAHVAAQKHYQAVSAGLSSNTDGEDATLNEQLMTARKEISVAESETKEAQMRLKHANQEIKKKQGDLKKTEVGYKKDQTAYEAIKKNMQNLENEMKKLGYEEGRDEKLLAERKTLMKDVQRLRETLETMEARFPNLRFEYKDPEKNFNRKEVHGLLYNVVVQTEVTGKKILQKGELKRRYTFIPLNKISARSINPDVVKKAESLAAMEYVFGSAFVCKDMDTAKKVTFHEGIMKKSVTLSGDSFDPAGTLTGGARASVSSILEKLQELKEVHDELNTKEQKLAQVEKELESLRKVSEKFTTIKQQYDLKVNEAELVKARLEQSSHHHQLEEINNLQKSIEEVQKKASKKMKDLEDKIKNAKAIREKELKEADTAAEELKKEITSYEEQLQTVDETIKQYEEQIKDLTDKGKEAKDAVKEAQAELNKQKDLLKSCNKDINQKVNEQKQLQKDHHNSELKIQELEHKITKFQADTKGAARLVESLLQSNDWIADEKKYFGQPNTAYDFTANDPKEAERRMQKLQETKEKLSKNVNMRAMNMLGRAEEQYADLLKKRKIVLNDKAKIAAVIAELDQKKNEALKKAWEQVNKDFGSIFSTLLPGANAKLSPPEGQSVLDGLEVKVGFGDVWKESLSELSGGQRSLIALSLILAMLLFKPAPIYILDEIDAALDISHTQNIGQMIKSHFKHSQFIVVSLKDGMFTNANVLYKTKFVDGVSTVTRYVQHQKSGSTNANKENQKAVGKKKQNTTKSSRLESLN